MPASEATRNRTQTTVTGLRARGSPVVADTGEASESWRKMAVSSSRSCGDGSKPSSSRSTLLNSR